MKNNQIFGKVAGIFRWLCLLCLWSVFHACQGDESVMPDKGMLCMQMEVDTTLSAPSTKSSGVIDFSAFKNVKNYQVNILKATDTILKYDRFEDMPETVELVPGEYEIQVSKGTEKAAAFDVPFFFGEKQFSIVKEMVTPIEVTASLANSMVTVDFTDDFLSTYPSYTLSFMTNKMTLPLVYEKGEFRPMFFQVDASGTKATIAMSLVNVYGKEVNYTTSVTLKPKQWSQLTVRTDEKGLNGLALDVTLDDGTKETVYVNIGIPDFMEQLKGAPWISSTGTAIKWTETNQDETFEKTYSSFIGVSKAPITVMAGGKIAQLVLSVYEGEKTLCSYDLANLDSEQREVLQDKYSLTLPENIKGEISVEFDLQGFLRSLFDEDERKYIIELTAIDALPKPNKTTKKVDATYKAMAAPTIKAQTVNFEEGTYKSPKSIMINSVYFPLKSFSFGKEGEEQIDLMVHDVEHISFKRSTALTPTSYTLKIEKEWFNALSSGVHVFTMKAIDAFGREVPSTLTVTVTPPAFEWAMAENDGDIFAKYAFLRVKAKEAEKVSFFHNGTQLSGEELISLGQDENGIVSFVWKHGQPNTELSVMAKYDGKRELESIAFTTEDTKQMPNNGFEEWYSNKVTETGQDLSTIKWKDYVYWNKWYPWNQNNVTTQGWNTINQTTTQYGAEPSMNTFIVTAPTAPYVGCCYVSTSGTIPTDDSKTGNKAVLVRTVGWGKENTAAAISGMGTCKNLTPGELYLGTYDVSTHTPLYSGYAFASRPFAVSFAYKYQPKNNSDWGVVEIEVKDNKDQTLIKKEEKLYSQSSYVVKEIQLDYLSASKAAKIYIKFKSSGNSECWGINSTNLTPPPARNLSNGEYVGSQLYIDDVELIYDYQE